MKKINKSRFYFEWKGHQIQDLVAFREIALEQRPDKPFVYLAGDSSLDNKYWVHKSLDELSIEVPKIYEYALDSPSPKPDIAFWMNHLLGDRATCINTAVEASMLRDRDNQLLPHDEFIRDHIGPQDILIVSVGANDIALSPLPATARHMAQLAWLTWRSSLEDGSATSLQYFKQLFGTNTQDYISRLVSRTKPRAIVVCMIYFPLEAGLGQTSWADAQLMALGYGLFPGQLQTAIKAMYETSTKAIEIDGTQVLPCALSEVLDGKDPGDYTARVEPNDQGGRKMAERFVGLLEGIFGDGAPL
ncbi:hypothetical protein P153DRAFT_356848 [Dothidotthia symphoricarpi CBS 119687]|uniref:SGNH hydrolase n=1 Tax=Dothidotthia symphoricarpi CBS 119687 TaxID=1392245 RepID=A0A6A6ADS6_9PLEO|nr:uncharacterized protein P153DRAFT_356848 [Dothidotthia symphoricarpi CBS 119687]KAF2129245.1 hypothetical protein P153DRAFT_356848 [Dothidotthia symphoricarpi CBS 119687]